MEKPFEIKMVGMKFDPPAPTIKPGTAVVWTNTSKTTTHNATREQLPEPFKTGDLGPGQTSEPRQFNKAGDFPYVCTIHEAMGMKGTIHVA